MPEDELREYVKNVENVEDRNMGKLWVNMEKMDIQEERRKTAGRDRPAEIPALCLILSVTR